jgi:hypothetical protein
VSVVHSAVATAPVAQVLIEAAVFAVLLHYVAGSVGPAALSVQPVTGTGSVIVVEIGSVQPVTGIGSAVLAVLTVQSETGPVALAV